MALLASTSSSTRLVQRAAGARRVSRPAPFTSARAASVGSRFQLKAKQDGLDYVEVEACIEQLKAETLIETEAAAALGVDEANVKNLSAASGDVIDEALDMLAAGGDVSEEVLSALSAYTAQLGASAEAVEGEDFTGPIANFIDPEFVLEGIPNADAVKANDAVASLKLPRSELTNLVPSDWDTETIEWFGSRRAEEIPLPEYQLTFIWGANNIGVAVDQVYARGQKSPLTEYHFWPYTDAWEELKAALEARPWITERDRFVLLNRLTEVINYWQEQETKHTVDEAKATFADCTFIGA